MVRRPVRGFYTRDGSRRPVTGSDARKYRRIPNKFRGVSPEDFIASVEEYSMTMEWGSCQYGIAYGVFHRLQELNASPEEAARLLGGELKHLKLRPDAVERYNTKVKADYQEEEHVEYAHSSKISILYKALQEPPYVADDPVNQAIVEDLVADGLLELVDEAYQLTPEGKEIADVWRWYWGRNTLRSDSIESGEWKMVTPAESKTYTYKDLRIVINEARTKPGHGNVLLYAGESLWQRQPDGEWILIESKDGMDKFMELTNTNTDYQKYKAFDIPVVIHNGDEMMEYQKGAAGDLWGAAPEMMDLTFDYAIEKTWKPNVDQNMPIGNIMVQEENFMTGLYCYILWKTGVVKDEHSFYGFDT